jgi:FKBP-type peptidyl-prolyl cis-trans isomerase
LHEKSIITIPSELAYGHNGVVEHGKRVIGPDAVLVFEIEIVDILK